MKRSDSYELHIKSILKWGLYNLISQYAHQVIQKKLAVE
jgi:hypothetical protein